MLYAFWCCEHGIACHSEQSAANVGEEFLLCPCFSWNPGWWQLQIGLERCVEILYSN